MRADPRIAQAKNASSYQHKSASFNWYLVVRDWEEKLSKTRITLSSFVARNSSVSYTQPHKDFPLGGRYQSVTLSVLLKINVRSSIKETVRTPYKTSTGRIPRFLQCRIYHCHSKSWLQQASWKIYWQWASEVYLGAHRLQSLTELWDESKSSPGQVYCSTGKAKFDCIIYALLPSQRRGDIILLQHGLREGSSRVELSKSSLMQSYIL